MIQIPLTSEELENILKIVNGLAARREVNDAVHLDWRPMADKIKRESGTWPSDDTTRPLAEKKWRERWIDKYGIAFLKTSGKDPKENWEEFTKFVKKKIWIEALAELPRHL